MNSQNRRMGYPTNPMYVHARKRAQYLARRGIDNALATHNLDAIVAPHLTNSTGPAVAGYPNLSLPVGIRPPSGKPAGMLMYSTFLREPKLIGFAYDLEQRMKVRRQPQFLGSVIPVPNADLCDQPHGAGSGVHWNSEDAGAQPHLLKLENLRSLSTRAE